MAVVMTIFSLTGILKLTSSTQEIAQFVKWGYPLWFMYLTGVLNIIFAIGLCVKKVSHISAFALMALLSTAIMSNFVVYQSLVASLPALLLISALAGVLYIDKNIHKSPN